MVCWHWQRPRPTPILIKNGLCRIVWRCSHCSQTLSTAAIVSVSVSFSVSVCSCEYTIRPVHTVRLQLMLYGNLVSSLAVKLRFDCILIANLWFYCNLAVNSRFDCILAAYIFRFDCILAINAKFYYILAVNLMFDCILAANLMFDYFGCKFKVLLYFCAYSRKLRGLRFSVICAHFPRP